VAVREDTTPHTARGPADGEHWPAVTDALNARMTAVRMTQQALANASGVSVATLRLLQRGVRGRRVQDATLAAVSRALGWPDDHLLRVLLTGRLDDPGLPQAAGTPEPGMRDLHETLQRMEAQLEAVDGRLADVDVRLAAIEQALTAPREPDTRH
jgi:transcriptional regulator with XRE-family HTH domain